MPQQVAQGDREGDAPRPCSHTCHVCNVNETVWAVGRAIDDHAFRQSSRDDNLMSSKAVRCILLRYRDLSKGDELLGGSRVYHQYPSSWATLTDCDTSVKVFLCRSHLDSDADCM